MAQSVDKNKQEPVDKDKQDMENEARNEYGEATLSSGRTNHRIFLISMIGEIEGHDLLPASSKTTKYEHVLPKLAQIEDDAKIDGVLILINSCGGDVDAGLAIAEMIASLSKPTVSLVLGGSHSISVPLAVAADYSFIVSTGTMIVHPVRMSGTIIGAPQTYDYFKRIQDRILGFVVEHSKIPMERIEKMMFDTGYLTKDLGTILVGKEAVEEGLIDECGGMKDALNKLHQMIEQ